MRQFNVRLEVDLYEEFRALCEAKERSMTGEVRWLIKKAVEAAKSESVCDAE